MPSLCRHRRLRCGPDDLYRPSVDGSVFLFVPSHLEGRMGVVVEDLFEGLDSLADIVELLCVLRQVYRVDSFGPLNKVMTCALR